MSVSNNIPQHGIKLPRNYRTYGPYTGHVFVPTNVFGDRPVFEKLGAAREHFRAIVGAFTLYADYWPASRPVPTDGRHTRRVQKQVHTADTQRMRRVIRGHVISKV